MPFVARADRPGSARLLWLDGARGIAAITVMCYHYEEFLHLRPLLNSAYLAVDLFFMMSGFVLSHSYENKLQSGQLTTSRYMVTRAIRLYPTYLVATALGLAYYASKIMLRTDDAPRVMDLLHILCANLLFIPITTVALVPQGMFPFAPSSWSLATEVVASIVYGLMFVRARIVLLLSLMVVFGCVFFGCVVTYHSFDLGWGISNFIPGIFRTLFEFTIGIALYRVSDYSASKRLLKPAVLLAIVTATLMAFRGDGVLGLVLCTFMLFPLFILSAEGRLVDGMLNTAFHHLGRVSYPVYLLHTPVLLWFAGVYKLVAKQDPFAMNVRWLGWAMVAGTLVLSYIVARWIDEPCRLWLNRRTRHIFSPARPAVVEGEGIASNRRQQSSIN